MTEQFYLPLDSVLAPLSQNSSAMESPFVSVPEEQFAKLNEFDVSIAEIPSEAPTTPEFDRLTMLTMYSPEPHSRPGTVKCYPDISKGIGFPRSSSPTGSVRSAFGGSRRHVRKGTRWSGGFKRSHSHSTEVSRQLTTQAESEFFALKELISSVSRRSSSLKEVWVKILAEREACDLEMERMYEYYEEYTETIERERKEQHGHQHEHEERKNEISKLRLEITAAVSATSEYKLKLAERDTELGNSRREIAEFKDNFKYLKEEHEETKTTLEETQLKLVVCEEARRCLEEDTKKHHGEIRTLKQHYAELQSSHSELTTKYESTHKETISLKQSNTTLKTEKHEWLHEKGELEEGLRKCHHRCDELKRKVKEITESYERKVREVHELKETVTKTKYENEELHQTIKELRRQYDDEHCRWEDAEDRCGKWKLKWEHSEREVRSVKEEISRIEVEKTELHETVIKKSEELRQVTIEKERFEENYHDECKKFGESHRLVLALQESMRRTETTIREKTETIHTLHERIERIECERDEVRQKCSDLSVELSQFQSSIVSLKLEIETVTEQRESFCHQLHECETRYEEVCTTISEYEGGDSGSEFEINNLRGLLRETREQKEKAISMRNSADRERDEAIVKYEEKCREIERLEESFSQQFSHSHGRSGGRSTTRYFSKGSRSASTVHEHEYE
ncbi:hypothetical protein LSUE1_G009223 [Lachnellula suecica]|uniref:Uncharacterized protein n=1 Tax=Lachnellula suecica TaxID=602035 RepID=A0A8T9CB59_9HELO|nr:hypothetical protein LSUE1_G009223 [Lachnellula suecica]